VARYKFVPAPEQANEETAQDYFLAETRKGGQSNIVKDMVMQI